MITSAKEITQIQIQIKKKHLHLHLQRKYVAQNLYPRYSSIILKMEMESKLKSEIIIIFQMINTRSCQRKL